MAGTGVEDAFNVQHTGVLQALDGAAHALALLAHRVGIAGEEKQRQVFGHPCQKSRVVQTQDAAEHTVIGIQRKGKGAALLGQILVHLGLIAVEPVMGGAALQPLVVAHKGKVGHKAAAVVPTVKDCQHPAKGLGCLDQRLGLEAGAHDDGAVQLPAVLAQVLPGIEGTHAVSQQKVGQIRVKLLGKHGHSVQVGQHGAVAVRLSKIAVILFGADGRTVSQMVVPGDQNAPVGQIFCQGAVAVDVLHHAVGQLQHRPHLSLRDAAKAVQGAPRHGGGKGKVDELTHGKGLPSELQCAELAAAGGTDAVAAELDGLLVHLAAKIAAAGRAVLFQDDGVPIHKDLQLGVGVEVHTGAQFLRQNDTSQRINAADDASAFHNVSFSFTISFLLSNH